jgi:hypothetical protein
MVSTFLRFFRYKNLNVNELFELGLKNKIPVEMKSPLLTRALYGWSSNYRGLIKWINFSINYQGHDTGVILKEEDVVRAGNVSTPGENVNTNRRPAILKVLFFFHQRVCTRKKNVFHPCLGINIIFFFSHVTLLNPRLSENAWTVRWTSRCFKSGPFFTFQSGLIKMTAFVVQLIFYTP